MVYGAQFKTSMYLEQYLKTATGGNVHAEFSVLVHRWRLVCNKCGASRTYGDEYDLETSYEKDGVLDSNIQSFARAHRHGEERPLKLIKLVPVEINPTHMVTSIPRRSSGRKIRP